MSIRKQPRPALESLEGIDKEQAEAFAKRLAPGLSPAEHFVEPERWRAEMPDGSALDVWLVSVPRGVVFRAGTTTLVGEIFDARMTHSLAELSLLPDAAAASPDTEHSLLGRFGRSAVRVRKAEEAAQPVAPPPGPPFEGEIASGALAFVSWRGQWFPAQILSKSGELYRIHYDGWDAKWDEYVTRERVCQAPTRLDVEVGAAVSVEYRGAWYAARILAVHDDGRLRVTYDGWDASWDEDVVPGRVKTAEASGLPGRALGGREVVVGMPLYIAYDGAWYEGSVLQLEENGGYLIHYDGWDSSWDEVVEESRLRLRDIPAVN